LGGERLGIHSLGSPNTALINSYISQKCHGTQPQIIVVSGSDNRATALLAGQLDAGLLEIADWVQLDAKAPGKFHIIFNFAQDLPDIVITGMYVSDDFAAKHPVAVKDYLRANLQVNRDIAQDHSILLNEAASQLDIGAAQLKPVVEEYMQLKAWDVNGGLTVEKVKANVDFVKTLEGTDPNITPENAADLSYLNAVLDEIGRK
jgi:NitT/TauT family transport system substrate-binding protein